MQLSVTACVIRAISDTHKGPVPALSACDNDQGASRTSAGTSLGSLWEEVLTSKAEHNGSSPIYILCMRDGSLNPSGFL